MAHSALLWLASYAHWLVNTPYQTHKFIWRRKRNENKQNTVLKIKNPYTWKSQDLVLELLSRRPSLGSLSICDVAQINSLLWIGRFLINTMSGLKQVDAFRRVHIPTGFVISVKMSLIGEDEVVESQQQSFSPFSPVQKKQWYIDVLIHQLHWYSM